MLILALTIVSAFEAVGVILVISMLIFPSVTASFFFSRMPAILFSTLPLSVVYSTGGFFLARWLDCSIAGAMVLVAGFFFSLSWAFGPNEGLLWQILKHKKLPNKKEKEREDTKKASSFPEAF
jgi:manganese/zinc/iron transport system permease protein